jgi:peptidoglycan/xylan/chitin deacetylase (PgdA/CDA1 family)
MSISKSFLKGIYHPLKIARGAGRTLGWVNDHSLRVLIFHDVAPQEYKLFGQQMRWLAKSWNFVTPAQFAAMASGRQQIEGRNLLVTFDDGFASNREVAKEILNPMGIKAIFFAVSDFIDMRDDVVSRRFIKDKICVGLDADPLPLHWKNMSWNDLAALLEQGHTIGAHTKTHARLSEITDPAELKKEIVDSADIISAKLGVDIDHFAYTFGDLNSISRQALEIAKSRFRFIYSGIRGDNAGNTELIFRDAAATQDEMLNYFIYPNNLLGSFLEGAADFRYDAKRKKIQDWYQS